MRWTKEMCKEESLKYKSRTEFKINAKGAYCYALKNNFSDEICKHMPIVKKPSGYWTFERCKEEALKHKTKREFVKKCPSAYKKSNKEKWLVDICSHMVSLGDIKHRCIYAYEFSDNSVYVGLTFDIDDRKNRHKNDEGSAVYRHTHKTGIKPKLIKLTEYLEIKIAKKKEGEYVEKYKESGWIILNIVETGGLGNMPRKWTKENCKNESLKYKTKTEFRNNNKSAYNTTLKYKWMDYVCSHMINKK